MVKLKRKVRVSVITSLLLAPTVLDGSNEVVAQQINPNVLSYNTVANIEADKLRLDRIQKLNEETTITDFSEYATIISALATIPDGASGTINDATIIQAAKDLLTAKVAYIKGIKDLDVLTSEFNKGVSNLKATNTTLAVELADLQDKLAKIDTTVLALQRDLDAKLKEAEDEKLPAALINDVLKNLVTYVDGSTSAKSDKYKAFKGITTTQASLKALADDLVRVEAFVKGGKIKVPSTADTAVIEEIEIAGFITVKDGLLESSQEMALTNPANIPKFRDKLAEVNTYYKENFSKSQQQMATAYALIDQKTTVGEVIKAANDDLAAADKLNKEIDAVATKVFKTGAALNSELLKHKATYDKLNSRQKVLSTSYRKLADYDDILNVMLQIDALKAAATKEYHDAVKKALDDYTALATPDKATVNNGNYAILASAEKSVKESEPVIARIVDISTAVKDNKTPIEIAKAITDARTLYNGVDAAAKKIVYNYKELQEWEKAAKTTLSVDTAIGKLTITNSKAFGTSVAAVVKKYDVLTDNQKNMLVNRQRLLDLQGFSEATADFYNLKLTAVDYVEKVKALETKLNDLLTKPDPNKVTTITDQVPLKNLHDKLTADVKVKLDQIKGAVDVDTAIEDAEKQVNPQQKFNQTLAAREAYTKLGESSKDAQKLVKNLKILTALEKAMKKSVDVIKKLDAVDIESANLPSKAKTAYSAYDKLTSTEKGFLPTNYTNLALNFGTYLSFVDQMKAIKPSSPEYIGSVADARKQLTTLKGNSAWKLTSPDTAKTFKDQVSKYEPTIVTNEKNVKDIDALIKAIDKLGAPGSFFNDIQAIEAGYALLPSNVRNQVTNYKQFQTLKKDATAAMKVVDLISQDVIKQVNVKSAEYAKRFATAQKAYDKLTSAQKRYVYNYQSGLKPYLNVYEFVVKINDLKPTSKTYVAEVNAVRAMYNKLSQVERNYVKDLLPTITSAEEDVAEVAAVIKLIDEAKPGVNDYVQKLEKARAAYDALAGINPAYQKLVTNSKTLTDREKQLQPVTTAIYQIKELVEILARPKFEAADFVKKYNVAIQSFEKIDYEARELVYNREDLFTAIYPLAKTIESIDKLTATSATIGADAKEARAWYDSLSEVDRVRVPNYDKLLSFETVVSTGNEVDQMIMDIASQLPSQYIQAIKDARAAYDALTAEQKKAVTRYKELQSFEKGIANVQAAIDAIDNLQFASNLVAAYDKASKAMDKLTAEQRQMIPNISKLQSVAPAIEVYRMIEALKPSNANYSGAVQAAFAAYNMLSNAEKQYVTNFANLQDAKNNVDLVQQVIAKISAISPSSKDYAKQVEEAMALYNSLPATVKNLVTNAANLKASQTEVTAVDKVKQLITEIDPDASTFAEKVKAARAAYDKLSTTQKRLVGNYFLLEDYESELENDSSFFFF